MNERALLALKLSILPFLVLLWDFAPALLANWQIFAFNLDIEFNVFTVAGVFPWVFTMFHIFSSHTHFDVFAFKAVAETYSWFKGGVSESETLYAKFSIGNLWANGF